MRWMNVVRGSLVAVAMVGMVLPQLTFAAAQAADNLTPNIDILDVTLQEDGTLRGQVLDSQGAPVAKAVVAVVHQGKAVAAVTTDAEGRYAVPGLNSGVYQVVTDKGITVCRVWTTRTAPPASQAEALVVNGDQVIRGGLGNRGLGSILSNPWVLGAIVATAIAVPLALDDDDDGS